MSAVCVLLLLAAALLLAAPQGARAVPSVATGMAAGTLAVDDGHVDLATHQLRHLAVESGDAKRGGSDGKGPAVPVASVRPPVPGDVPCLPATAGPPVRAAAVRLSDRTPTGPPAA